MEGLKVQGKDVRMVDYMRKHWLLYNFRMRSSDPFNAHIFAVLGGRVRGHTQNCFGQRHAQQTMAEGLTEGPVQHGTQ
jgi:hypothetical protein